MVLEEPVEGCVGESDGRGDDGGGDEGVEEIMLIRCHILTRKTMLSERPLTGPGRLSRDDC